MIGTLVSCGHDLNNLLDNYTIEQLEIMSMSIFQHRLTQLKLVAYAVGGKDAKERVPTSRDASDRRRRGGRTPEEEQKQRELALAQLMGLQGKVGRAARDGSLQAAPDNKVQGRDRSLTRDGSDPTGVEPSLKSQLDRIKTIRSDD